MNSANDSQRPDPEQPDPVVGAADSGGDYLWDKSGAPDADVQFLERALSPLTHDARPLSATGWAAAAPSELRDGPAAAAAPPPVDATEASSQQSAGRPGENLFRLLAVVAGVAALVVASVLVWDLLDDRTANQLPLVRASNRAILQEGDRLVTENTETLTLGEDISTITVEGGSVLYVDKLQKELTHLRLERGSLTAFVSGEAKERFFQVATSATNCVDLGCEYTLTVDQDQTAKVEVTMGRVAFEDRGREVRVPANATCIATKRHGAGTPRHLDLPEPIVELVDDFDAARGPARATERSALARQILAGLVPLVKDDEPKYSLIAWHFLQDPAPAVREKAQTFLLRHFAAQKPETFELVTKRGLTESEMRAWRENLEPDWGW